MTVPVNSWWDAARAIYLFAIGSVRRTSHVRYRRYSSSSLAAPYFDSEIEAIALVAGPRSVPVALFGLFLVPFLGMLSAKYISKNKVVAEEGFEPPTHGL